MLKSKKKRFFDITTHQFLSTAEISRINEKKKEKLRYRGFFRKF